MSVDAPKPVPMQPIDYADHTLEVDTRWLLADRPELKEAMERASEAMDEDPRITDLTATQVNELLNLAK
jgi:hypothetical protein